jgi:hypothetical protein
MSAKALLFSCQETFREEQRNPKMQTTSVGEVTSEVHTSVASVEAPRKTRRNRKSDCVHKPRESLKS